MKIILITVISILGLFFVVATLWGANYFFRGAPLPPVGAISSIFIGYNENISSLDSENTEFPDFEIVDPQELMKILESFGSQRIAPMPLINSDLMADGPNWMINVYFKDGRHRYIYVDKNLVSSRKIKNSRLYQFLNSNYR